MGTQSTIQFIEGGEVYASIYQQFDGYPNCAGLTLAKFCAERSICNGFSNETNKTHANGIGCLAAQFIAEIKTDIGGVYIVPPNPNNEEFNYKVIVEKGEIFITCLEANIVEPSPAHNLVELWSND